MEKLICDYCHQREAKGVYAADHGPFSLAECEECLKHSNLRTLGNGINKWVRFGDKAFGEYKDWNKSEPKIYFKGGYHLLRDVVSNLTEDDIKIISDSLGGQIKQNFINKVNEKMTTLEEVKYFLLDPYGFEIAEVKYDEENYTPYRDVTHPSHPNKVWRYTPVFAQDINGPQGTVDMLPIIQKELEKVFGYEEFAKVSVNFVNPPYPSYNIMGNTREKRIFTIDVGNVPEEKLQEYIEELKKKLKGYDNENSQSQ